VNQAEVEVKVERKSDFFDLSHDLSLNLPLTLADFFSILLQYRAEYADIQTMTNIDLPTEFQGAPFFK